MMPLVSATACLFVIGVWRRFVGVIVALARRPDECIARVHAAWARGAAAASGSAELRPVTGPSQRPSMCRPIKC